MTGTILALLLTLLAAGWLFYQPEKQQTETHPEKHATPAPPDQTVQRITGTVTGYGSNPEGDIDKIQLRTNRETIWLHFPPHAARQVTKAAPISAIVEVNATRHDRRGPRPELAGQGPILELRYLQDQSTKSEADLTAIPAPAPREGIEVKVKGISGTDLSIQPGQENAFVLSGKLVLLPPHMARELLPLIRRARVIFVKGKMRDSTEGFVSASGKPVIKANLIRLDSITYKIR